MQTITSTGQSAVAQAQQASRRAPAVDLSVLIPVFNEEPNLELLYNQLVLALDSIGYSWEVVFVDDGSTDGSFDLLRKIAARDDRFKIVRFVRNFGQTAALAAGIDHAEGKIIIPMDADLQNDPKDIKALLDKMKEGYDVVSGWRKDRKDPFFSRTLPSVLANKMISVIGGVPLHDYGCSLKAYRRSVLKNVKLYGEMHRFVPIYATWQGAKVAEIPVRHHPRQFGKSKYGIARTLKVVLDLITVKFMSTYFTKPIYLFGSAAIFSFAVSCLAFIWMVILKYFYDTTFIETPLPVLIAMFFMISVQLLLMGLLAELLMRTYHESQGKKIYIVDTKLNTDESFDPSDE